MQASIDTNNDKREKRESIFTDMKSEMTEIKKLL